MSQSGYRTTPLLMLPKPPTTSLYKFLTILGMSLIGFALFEPRDKIQKSEVEFRTANVNFETAMNDSDNAKVQITKRLNLIESDIGHLKQILGTLATKSQTLKDQIDGLSEPMHLNIPNPAGTSAGDVLHMIEQRENYKNSLIAQRNDLEKQLADNQVSLSGTEHALEEAQTDYDDVSTKLKDNELQRDGLAALNAATKDAGAFWRWIGLGGLLIGGTFTLFGLTMWYFREQQYRDAILAQKASFQREESQAGADGQDHSDDSAGSTEGEDES